MQLKFVLLRCHNKCIIIAPNSDSRRSTRFEMKTFNLLLLALSITGCSYFDNILTAKPAPDSGFLDHPEQMKPHPERFPFNRVWCENHGCDWSKYKSIIVSQVDTSHIIKMSWWENFNTESKSQLQEDRHAIAIYLKESFESTIQNDPAAHHEVINSPRNRTMILEMALVELVPTKAFMRSIMDIVGFLIPGAQVLGITGSGSVAIEGRIRDAETGEIIFKFADRQQDKTAVISVQDLTWHGHAKEIIDDWAGEFVELYDTPPSHMVAVSSHFTLMPW